MAPTDMCCERRSIRLSIGRQRSQAHLHVLASPKRSIPAVRLAMPSAEHSAIGKRGSKLHSAP